MARFRSIVCPGRPLLVHYRSTPNKLLCHRFSLTAGLLQKRHKSLRWREQVVTFYQLAARLYDAFGRFKPRPFSIAAVVEFIFVHAKSSMEHGKNRWEGATLIGSSRRIAAIVSSLIYSRCVFLQQVFHNQLFQQAWSDMFVRVIMLNRCNRYAMVGQM